MTIHGFRKVVPVYKNQWIRLIDIFNPFRFQFYADSVGISSPSLTDQVACYWDWELWLSERRHLEYSLCYPHLYRYTSDEEDARPISLPLM